MAYLIVEDFRAGLDARRDKLAAQPGTLVRCVNAHITRGGDVEGRKEFVEKYTLPAGTFGLHTNGSKLYVFGSAAAPGVPAGTTYQRLSHPDGATAMTGLVWAENFDGKIYAVADYADGNTFHFYDGVHVQDWDVIARKVASQATVASALARIINERSAFSAEADGNVFTISGAAGQTFAIVGAATDGSTVNDQTLTKTDTQAAAAAVAEVLAAGSFDITGGSGGNNINSVTVNGVDVLGAAVAWNTDAATTATDVATQINAYTSAPNYTAAAVGATVTITATAGSGAGANGYVVAVNKDAGITIANIVHMAGGVTEVVTQPQITTFELGGTFEPEDTYQITLNGEVFQSTGFDSAEETATDLAAQIDAHASFTASASGKVVTVQAGNAVTFTGAGTATNGATVNDQTLTVVQTQAAVTQVDEVLATASFDITGGAGGAGDEITSVTINGVEVLGAAVPWSNSNTSTAAAVAAKISSFASTPEYTAAYSGPKVIISAVAGTGATPNGFVLAVTPGGLVTVGSLANMAGGVTEVKALPQVEQCTIGGTFEPRDSFKVTLDGTDFLITGIASGMARLAMTHKSKLQAITSSLLYGSAINRPDIAHIDATFPGFGFVNMSTQDGGSQDLTGLAVYNSNVAVFSRDAVIIEYLDEDPALNRYVETVKETGTRAPGSVRSYGNTDVFYLSETGIRSIRSRDLVNAAYVSDVGTAIDPLVKAWLATLTEGQIIKAKAAVEPDENRYWLVLGTRIYVFSYFPGTKISAWSHYETSYEISDIAIRKGRLYARSGDTVYLYGGDDGATYPAKGALTVTVQLPYLDAKTPATQKELKAFDVGCRGVWKIYVLCDPDDESVQTVTATVSGPTYNKGSMPLEASGTHFAPVLECSEGGYCLLSNFVLHYDSIVAD